MQNYNSFEYRLELKGVNSTELAYVVDEKFGQTLQDAGVTTVIVDNDRKAHRKMVRNAWAKFGIRVLPGAGVVGDRALISQFTGEEEEKLGGFPVNSPDCMVNDQSVNNSWKNLLGGLYDTFNKRKPSRQTNGVSSMTSTLHLKTSVKRKSGMQSIFSQRLWKQ